MKTFYYLCALNLVCACIYTIRTYIRIDMKQIVEHSIRTVAMMFSLLIVSEIIYAIEPAGITPDKATRITAPVTLTVQSGSNYIRFEEKLLPAVVTYIPSASFGSIPTALIMGDTIEAEMVFADCNMTWRWTIEKAESVIAEIKAHEDAIINVAPYTCNSTFGDTTALAYDSFTWYEEALTTSGDYTHVLTNAEGCDSIVTLHLTIQEVTCSSTSGDTTAVACDAFTWYGESLTTSGDYTHVLTNAEGCDSIVTLHLTIRHATSGELTIEKCERYISPSGKEYTNSGTFTETISNVSGCDSVITINLTILHDCMGPTEYDTVFFCRGFNTEHEELMGDGIVRRYRQYVFQSPAEWDFMEGVIVAGEPDRTLLDLRRAEKNLYAHYVEGLTPVSAIRWSVQYDGKGKYEPLTVTDEPQWVETGHVAVQVNFLCGEMYNTEFPTDIEHVSQDAVSIKRIENGRVVIVRGGAKYDILGTRIQ